MGLNKGSLPVASVEYLSDDTLSDKYFPGNVEDDSKAEDVERDSTNNKILSLQELETTQVSSDAQLNASFADCTRLSDRRCVEDRRNVVRLGAVDRRNGRDRRYF